MWKLNKKMAAMVALLPVLLPAAYCHYDTQALPRAVDIAGGIVGDEPILFLEKRVFGVSGWANERLYSAKLRIGLARPHPAVVAPLPAPKADPVPAALGAVAAGRPARSAGEGRWADKGSFFTTFVHPEPKLDSIADMVWLKPGQTAIHLVCGTQEPRPGGTGTIPAGDRRSVVLAFSGGFKYRHDLGGMALDGKLLRPMRAGMGTFVLFRDGTVKVGKWGRDWKALTPQMRDARQGLMLVDRGAFCYRTPFNIYAQDGKTYVRRSALGLTRRGEMVYATGDALSAGGLARAMIAAGVVSAVHLEMNCSRVLCGVPRTRNGKLTFAPLTPRCCDPRSLAGRRDRDFFYVTKSLSEKPQGQRSPADPGTPPTRPPDPP